MLTCDICGEELLLEEDMKTHLLLSHLEDGMSCPLCPLSGVSYDELSYHINAAHPENQVQAQKTDSGSNVHSNSSSFPSLGGKNVPFPLSRDNCSTAKGGSTILTKMAVESKQKNDVIRTPSQTTSANGVSFCAETSSTNETSTSILTPGSVSITQDSEGGCAGDDEARDNKSQGGFMSELSEVKRKQLSSPVIDEQFLCPMCALACSNVFTLQEHVEVHLQEKDSAKGAGLRADSATASPSPNSITEENRYMCPICSVVCVDHFALHQHVDVHFHSAGEDSAVSPSSDLRLARQLQLEEDERRRKEEAKREEVEFKKLKEQFGMDGSGGYRRQIERNMSKAVARGLMTPADFHTKRAKVMESLASGVDDGTTRTQGTLGALCEYYQREAQSCLHVWLSADTDHYNSSEGDKGWGCGYRNAQMLLSALQRTETFAHCLPEKEIPSVPQIQRMIEGAWKEGLDPQGASHFNHRLLGTRAWIGATEIYALLTSMGLRTHITDFHQPTGPGDTHPRIFEWVKQYFSQSTRGARLPPRVVQTTCPPLYLQHQGHSRTIIGVEERRNGSLCLLVFDPGCGLPNARKLLSRDGSPTSVRHIQRFLGNMKHKQYQVVAVDGVLSPEDRQVCIQNSRTLRAERIP